MSAPERRALASRIPELATIAPQLKQAAAHGRAIPLLYVEFGERAALVGSNGRRSERGSHKQAAAAALKTSLGTILRRNDLVAAGRGGKWFIAALLGRNLRSRSARLIDADLGMAAERLRLRIQRELHRLSGEDAARVAVRCGWNVFEPALAGDVLEGLRHAIRGAALVARVEERRALVLSAVTHELRTPLTSIIGFSERLQSERAPRGQQKRWLGTIAEEARRLHRLADGLIDIGAWSAGGLKLRLAACSLRSVAKDAIQAIAERAKQRGVPIIVGGSARVIADRDRLFQVVINLLDNALRHTPGGRRIRVHVRSTRRHATLAIRDGGPGFCAADRSAAGTPFSAGPEGKTGLGLAIARILIEAHGGELKLGGSKAQGGLVSVTLPLEKNAVPRRVAGANIRL